MRPLAGSDLADALAPNSNTWAREVLYPTEFRIVVPNLLWLTLLSTWTTFLKAFELQLLPINLGLQGCTLVTGWYSWKAVKLKWCIHMPRGQRLGAASHLITSKMIRRRRGEALCFTYLKSSVRQNMSDLSLRSYYFFRPRSPRMNLQVGSFV